MRGSQDGGSGEGTHHVSVWFPSLKLSDQERSGDNPCLRREKIIIKAKKKTSEKKRGSELTLTFLMQHQPCPGITMPDRVLLLNCFEGRYNARELDTMLLANYQKGFDAVKG